MQKRCAECRGPLLVVSMTAAEEARFAAAFRCLRCGWRSLETWDEAARPSASKLPIEEK